MDGGALLERFFLKCSKDARVSIAHIGLYATLVHFRTEQGGSDPLTTFSSKVMPRAKISSSATYHKLIKELNEYGYIIYKPSFSNVDGSRFYFR
jgi:hypothetical protein